MSMMASLTNQRELTVSLGYDESKKAALRGVTMEEIQITLK